MMPKTIVKKICLLGNGKVGKTSLIRKFVFDTFADKYIKTFGTKVTKKKLTIQRSDIKWNLTFLIWDILGQKMHDRLHSAYYKGAAGSLIVCDVTRKETLESLEDWINVFHNTVLKQPVIFLGNKCDMLDEAEFGAEELGKLASKFNIPFYLTSAKSGEDVEKAFYNLGELIIARRDDHER
jgi:small GTP-binding protein